MNKLLIAAALVLGSVSAAPAQDIPPGEAAAIEEMLEVMRTEETMQETMELMLVAQMGQSPELAGMETLMRDFLNETLSWNELRPDFVRMYADLFTEDEIRQMTAFYRTPVGQKMVASTPQLTVRSSEIANERVMAKMPELMSRIMAHMAENETDN